MTIDALSVLIGLVGGYGFALLTIYLTAVCTRRLGSGQSIAPKLPTNPFRKPTDDDESAEKDAGWSNPYGGYKH